MPRRPRLPPDTRLDWRDPNMPVLVSTHSQGMVTWDPDRAQRAYADRLAMSNAPSWHSDPTYNLRRPKC